MITLIAYAALRTPKPLSELTWQDVRDSSPRHARMALDADVVAVVDDRAPFPSGSLYRVVKCRPFWVGIDWPEQDSRAFLGVFVLDSTGWEFLRLIWAHYEAWLASPDRDLPGWKSSRPDLLAAAKATKWRAIGPDGAELAADAGAVFVGADVEHHVEVRESGIEPCAPVVGDRLGERSDVEGGAVGRAGKGVDLGGHESSMGAPQGFGNNEGTAS